MAAAAPDRATIVNSGSTNTRGYTIAVASDGSGSLTSQGTVKAFRVPMATVQRFFTDLAAARKAKIETVACVKSASFGSTIRVTWQGWTSPDLACPPKDAVGAALVDDVEAIRTASGMSSVPLRGGPVHVESTPP